MSILNVISLGAGVQSTTVALGAACGVFKPMPDCAIFADTGAEPAGVMRHLDWLETQLPFPVYRVQKAQGLRENIISSSIKGGRFAGAPFYTEPMQTKVPIYCDACGGDGCAECNDKGIVGYEVGLTAANGGQLRRQCTREFKIEPIHKKVRELLGLASRQRLGNEVRVRQWIGISLDEAMRAKPSQWPAIENVFPLLEARMTRLHCLRWMEERGYPKPAKSACTFCPYHDDSLWADMKSDDPDAWDDAVNIDRMIRGGVRGTSQKLYLHRSMKPLEEIDFSHADGSRQGILFNNECEGMCGV